MFLADIELRAPVQVASECSRAVPWKNQFAGRPRLGPVIQKRLRGDKLMVTEPDSGSGRPPGCLGLWRVGRNPGMRRWQRRLALLHRGLDLAVSPTFALGERDANLLQIVRAAAPPLPPGDRPGRDLTRAGRPTPHVGHLVRAGGTVGAWRGTRWHAFPRIGRMVSLGPIPGKTRVDSRIRSG